MTDEKTEASIVSGFGNNLEDIAAHLRKRSFAIDQSMVASTDFKVLGRKALS